MDNIVLERIPQKKIRKYIQQQQVKIKSFGELKPSFKIWAGLDELFEHDESFICPFGIDKTWEFYLKSNPKDVWNGKLVSFGLMLCKSSNGVIYCNDSFEKAEIGQVYYINLKLLGGLYNLAVSHEIVNINSIEKYIEISYVEGGKSIGIQRISLHPDNKENTIINHKTFYRSKSLLRDKLIYPYFHTKVLNEYHSSMINHISKSLS